MNKCVVFDLDETIGFFAQLYTISKKFETTTEYKLQQHHIVRLYKHFYNIFRPGIFTLLAYAQFLKEKYNICIVLYTNTIMDDIWVDAFLQYTYDMVKLEFDSVMNLNSKCRSSTKKNLRDLYKCNSSLNSTSHIMIIDNKTHKRLLDKNILYVLVKTYYYVHNNNIIWNKIHELFNIDVEKKLENNEVSDDYNDILKKSTKNEILEIMSKLKVFSKS